jgi:cyclic beta-1,2-glucan synthetase
MPDGIVEIVDAPLRGTFMSPERLRRLGEELARGGVCKSRGLRAYDIQARNRENAEKIAAVFHSINEAQAAGEQITPAAQWLLDNNYLVEETVYQIRRDLPRRFYRQLPLIAGPDGAELPRVLALAWCYVTHTDSAVSPDWFGAIVDGYQSVEPLKIGELWALPSLLRFVLIENLRRLALRVEHSRIMRREANLAADRILAEPDEEQRRRILAGYEPLARHTSFATQLLFRLRDGSQNSGGALGWLESVLETAGTDAEEVIAAEHQTLSSGNVTVGNIIRGLRRINDTDWTDWFERHSRIDALLREGTNFAALDFQSRDQYRAEIEKLARRSNLSEYAVAEQALALADAAALREEEDCDIGFFLVGSRRRELEKAIGFVPPVGLRLARFWRRLDWLGIALPVMAMTLVFLAIAALVFRIADVPNAAIVVLLLLFALPASEGAVGLFNTLVMLLIKPTRLIGYEYREGIPEAQKTLVVIPTLIGSRDEVDEATRNLEVHYLANPKGAAYFALLTDWPDSEQEQTETDREILAFAEGRITELNARHPTGGPERFHLLHRRRLYNEAEGCWMGWERKRGKLNELNLLLRGDADTTFLPPRTTLPPNIVHVMTLDSDTRITREAVTRLVGKLAHPLNSPRLDPVSGRVIKGYAILQPRITPSLTTGDEASFFQHVFSANRGLDPYVFTVSDVYQDLFGEGTFTGKGLYHVDAFEAAIGSKIPENAVLSHDLLEGALARAALVTDVELVEDYPTRYAVDAARQHRWTRGDWQLLPLIFDRTLRVPALSRWKMIDNLRRSLMPLFWVGASIAGWVSLPLLAAMLWQAFLTLALFVQPTFDILASIIPRSRDIAARGHVHALARDIVMGTAQVFTRIVLIAHTAWLMGDAILRTLYRLYISRRHLLEWRTASQVQRGSARTVFAYLRLMRGSILIAAAAVAVPMLSAAPALPLAAAFAALWATAPFVAWFISLPAATEGRLELSPEERQKLRVLARRTWHYFETFVTEEHNYLPPDNFQERPSPVVASRTSPTNIGVYLLSIISARDFGWISLAETVDRLDKCLGTAEKLTTYRGHLFNWYDTRTLEPLIPRYVSTVDSGNLAGHLIAVAAACGDWAQAPAAHLEGDFSGILDIVMILEESLSGLPDDRRSLRPLRHRLRERISGARRAVETMRREPELAAVRTLNLTVLAGEVRKLAAAIHNESDTQQSEILLRWAECLLRTCEGHAADALTDEAAVETLRDRLIDLAVRARRFAFKMDFSFLLNRERNLLAIGYRVDDNQLDESCYDLLASEARLTSLFAIAKGDVPTEHWFHLGRPIVQIGFLGALMSWSGSMFEYLMPPLVMKEPRGGILNQTHELVIRRQIQYARSKGVPWGISEAAYNARDREMTYQYTNFGVPGLGLKRGLGEDLVIAPYASFLAAQFRPREALRNLARLAELKALGRYGYYDALDFTPRRVPEGSKYVTVANYMAHHQGMSITAVANTVFDGRLRDRFHSDPVIEASELLLQEKAPRDIPATAIRTEAIERVTADPLQDGAGTRIVIQPLIAPRATLIMSNGHYSIMLTATGSGYSRFDEQAVTRWRPDPVEDRHGTWLFLRDLESGEWWSATAEPRRARDEVAQVFFCDEKATFVKSVGTLRTQVEVIAVAEAQGEARHITIRNSGPADRMIEVTSFAELALAPEAADAAHPAFSKMFIKTEIDAARKVIMAARRPRSKGEAALMAAHFVTDETAGLRESEAETDRRAFIGRDRSIANPRAFDLGVRLEGHQGYTLDPIFALRRQVRVPAGKSVSLTFWTIVGRDRNEIEDAIERLDYAESFARQAMLSWTRSQVQIRHVGLTPADAANVQRLARYLLYPDPALRQPGEAIAQGLGPQSRLWPMAISGDFPIFALRIGDVADLEIVAKALRYQEYLRARGLLFDLVVVNEQAASYVQDLQQAIERLCDNSRARGRELGPRQHIFAVRRDLMDTSSYSTLLAAAHVVMHTRNGTIFDQIDRAELAERPLSPAPARLTEQAEQRLVSTEEGAREAGGLIFWNGYGGFTPDGREYVVRSRGGRPTPHPWINVIANESFGFHVSAEGAAFTWSGNSRDFQLTPWSNDPVVNRPGEGLYVRDEETGALLSPLAAVLPAADARYEGRHGQGYSRFAAERGDLRLELSMLVDEHEPVRITCLRLVNRSRRRRRLTAYAYAEWVLGNNRARTAPFIVPSHDRESGALLASNPYSLDYPNRFVFLASDKPPASFTSDRREFIGDAGDVRWPRAVLTGGALSGSLEAGSDPCAVLAREIELAPGGEAEMLFLLGEAQSPAEVAGLVRRHAARNFDERVATIRNTWERFLGTLEVDTPDPALNLMVNRWLPYQALACRIRARAGFYQASGAYGFRDQLQDTLALLLHDPSLARRQILGAAGRQFPEGDVQHWWLPHSGAGVRTRISDDVVWLAYAAARYIDVTGETAILDEEVAFIEGPPLAEGEHDAFFVPDVSKSRASLYEHCARALDLAVSRTGDNGLPLILGGDWNDGMNRVGEEGRGTSVWLGWFLAATLEAFMPFAKARNDNDRIRRWGEHLGALVGALNEAAWDGEWYLRGTYDDGAPLGSHQSDECRIDSIAQSWSVLSGKGEPAKTATAMRSALVHLADEQLNIVRLFTPPFEHTSREPGYIKSYPPGVRENGGQYTHAATWFVLALAELGHADEAWRWLSALLPVNHALDAAAAELYRVEPYVVAADIYSEGEHAGRGGWTWYTGSAGWLYRVAVEGLLGIRKRGDRLRIRPALPSAWSGFAFTLRLSTAVYQVEVRAEEGLAECMIEIDGDTIPGDGFTLASDGEHRVVVRLPRNVR